MPAASTPTWASNDSAVMRPYIDARRTLWRRIGSIALIVSVASFCLFYGFAFALFAPFLILQFMAPLGILAALAIWALPDVRYGAPTTAIEVLFFSFFIALMMWPDYLAIALPGLPWITLLRLIGFPLALITLICISTSPPFRSELATTLRAVPSLWKMLLAIVALQAISIAFSTDPSLSLNKFIVAQIYWTLIFFVSCYVFRKPGRVTRWVTLLWVMVILLGAIGLREQMISRVPWAGHIPSFLKIEDEAVLRILAGASRAATGIYRVQSTFTTSLGFAEYLAIATPFVLYFALESRNMFVRFLAAFSIPFIFYMIYLTDSRLGVVGFFLSILFYLLCWGALRWSRTKGSLFGPAIVLSYPVVFVGFITATFFVGRLRAMVWGSGAEQFSTESRLEQFKAGIPLVFKHPLGSGIGRGAETLGFTNRAGVLTIDTYYLAVALEYGIIGFIIYYGMILLAIAQSARFAMHPRRMSAEISFLVPIAIAMVNFFVIKSIFSQEENHPLIFMLLGMAVALIYRARRELDEYLPSKAVPTSSKQPSRNPPKVD